MVDRLLLVALGAFLLAAGVALGWGLADDEEVVVRPVVTETVVGTVCGGISAIGPQDAQGRGDTTPEFGVRAASLPVG